LKAKDPKPPAREQFTLANGKTYISTDELSIRAKYDLLHARTKGKYQVEAIFRTWEREHNKRKKDTSHR
jgi:hypothetical protein